MRGTTERLKDRASGLPVLPTVIAKLMMLDLTSESAFDEVRTLIEREPAFTTRLLVAANSVWSSPTAQVTSVQAALSRVGVKRAVGLLIAAGVTEVFVPRDAWQRGLWRHALEVATGSRHLATVAGSTELVPDEVYVCGLLHDLGHFVLFLEKEQALLDVEHRFWGSPKELLETEKEVAGTTHAELGALAAQRWGLPSHVAEVIRDHHVLRLEPVGRMQKTAAVVQLIDFALFPATATRVSSLELPLDELARRLAPFMPNFLRAVPIAVLKQALEEATAEAQAAIEALGLAEPTTR